MLVIILGLTLSVLDSTLVNLALPAMARELQSSSAHTLWVVNSYQLASLVLLLPLAALGERLGYRRVYLVGMLVFSWPRWQPCWPHRCPRWWLRGRCRAWALRA